MRPRLAQVTPNFGPNRALKNPELYNQLSKIFQVKVEKLSEPMTGRYVVDPSDYTQKFVISDWGETYRVSCPYCSDTRHRLYISHAWGTVDNVTKKRRYSLWKCFNEDCTKQSDFFDEFRLKLDSIQHLFAKNCSDSSVIINPIHPASEVVDVAPPGDTVFFKNLPEDHPGKLFLRSRGFDANRLGSHFGVSWINRSKLSSASNRIYVPIYFESKLVGWQARYVSPDGSGDCTSVYHCTYNLCGSTWLAAPGSNVAACPFCHNPDNRPTKVVKWYTGPGTKCKQVLYNYDIARAYDFVVVMEGAFDVFRLGTPTTSQSPGPGVACFGHTISNQQHALLYRWAKHGAIFLAFDSDVWDKQVELRAQMQAGYGDRFVPVRLPNKKDPADMQYSELWHFIRSAAAERGIQVRI